MKKIRTLQSVILQLAFITFISFSTVSCDNKAKTEDSNNSATEDSKEVAEDKNDNTRTKGGMNTEADAEFLVAAAESDQKEVRLGKLAQEKGSMTDVKELGKMMEMAHTESMTELSAFAKKKLVTLPETQTEMVNEAYTKLSNMKSGKEFDKEYCDMEVNGHKRTIEKFEVASTTSADPEIKTMATNMLPNLRKHLEMAEMCQKKCEAMK